MRIGMASDEAGTFRLPDGNPVGQAHDARSYTTRPGLTYNVNTPGMANASDAAIKTHYEKSPASAVVIELPTDLVINSLENPTATIGGRSQHLNFLLRGTVPGATLVCREPTKPAIHFRYVGYPSHRPTGVSYQRIESLDVLSRTPINVDGLGLGFYANHVNVRSDTTGWTFNRMYAGCVGRIYAIGCGGNGFEFFGCNDFTCDQMMARNCGGDGIKIVDSQAVNLKIDAENNKGFAMNLIRTRDSHFMGWMELGKRVRLERCEGITQQVNGWQIEEADRFSRVMNPALFTVTQTALPVVPLVEYSPGVFKSPIKDCDQCGVEVRYKVSGVKLAPNGRAGWVQINIAGTVPAKNEIFKDGTFTLKAFIEDVPGVQTWFEKRTDAGSQATVEILGVTKLEATE